MEITNPPKIPQHAKSRIYFILSVNGTPVDLEGYNIIFKWCHEQKSDSEPEIMAINNYASATGSVYVDWTRDTSDVSHGYYNCQFVAVNPDTGDEKVFPKSDDNAVLDFFTLVVTKSL